MDAVDLDKITNFGGYPFSITLRINNKNISIMLVDKHKVSIWLLKTVSIKITILLLLKCKIIISPIYNDILLSKI